jgi:chemotaxis protein MotB
LNNSDHAQEIIIIKRGGDEEDGHHGGAWKIAFADFMTAMMALFLVLWLINAANEETKKAVASYFNPVKLVDRNRSVKGIDDAKGVQGTEAPAPNEQFPEDTVEKPSADKAANSDTQFFADPFATLDEIAEGQAPSEFDFSEEKGGRNGSEAINNVAGGDVFIDPFSPNFWNEEVRQSIDSGKILGESDAEGQAEMFAETGASDSVMDGGAGADAAMKAAKAGQDMTMETASIAGEMPKPAPEFEPESAVAKQPDAGMELAAASMQEEIGRKLAEVLGEDSVLSRELTVVPAGKEILISLTDAFDISMYKVGSALPSRDLVVALEKIGGVLAEQTGGIRIRGHTDARPFLSRDYDNWRLSSARAQSAYYMLLRGGLNETRVREISGFADRQLFDTENPLSPKNRRIEVLVEVQDG